MPHQLARQLAERFVEIREREKAVEAELAAYKELVDLSPCPKALSTRDGVIIYVNQSYLEMLGVPLESVVVNGWHNLVADHDRERIVNLWRRVVEDKRSEIVSYVVFNTKEGELKVYWKAKLMRNNGYAIAIYHPGCKFLATRLGISIQACCDKCGM